MLPKEEVKSAGGLVLSSQTDTRTSTKENQADLAIVLAIGAGYIDNEGNDVAIDLAPGNVVLLSRLSLKYYSQFPGISEYTGEVLAMTRESEVHAAWPSVEAYEAYKKTLAND